MTKPNDTNEPSPASAGSALTPIEDIIRKTILLHALIQAGRDEGPEGEALRDSMDAPWLALSGSEQETARIVSAAIGKTY